MEIYINQINKRRAAEQAAMAEVNEKTHQRLGLQGGRRVVPQNDQSALRQVLEALGITDYQLDYDDVLSVEEQLTGILRPRGIMMRDIHLTGEWWRECVGPLLGYTKDGRLVALTPTKTGLGYQYRKEDGIVRQVGKRSGPNAVLLTVCALVVVLLGMFTPMANKLIFDTVIPTGDSSDLLPITGLLIGITIGSLLLTLTRNLYIIRLQHIIELHVQNAVVARTFLLSPTFFSHHSSGELTAKIQNITTVASLCNESIVGALLSAVLSIIYLVQVYIYGGVACARYHCPAGARHLFVLSSHCRGSEEIY